MILWIILKTPAYKALKKNKVLKGDWRRIDDRSFLPAYKWMASQMVARGIMEKSQSFLWAWHTFDDEHRMPDFRTEHFRSQLKYHKIMYRVAFKIPDNQVLLSDYEMWHFVLSGHYISLNEKEWDRVYPDFLFDKKKKKLSWPDCGTTTEAEVKKSWEHIFDLNFSEKTDPDWHTSYVGIQACFLELKLEWVKKIEKFTY